MIITKGLTKDYSNNRGIFDVSFSINNGSCVGFLGPMERENDYHSPFTRFIQNFEVKPISRV